MWKSSWKQLCQAHGLCGAGSQRITRTGWTLFARLVKSSDSAPPAPASWVEKGFNKGATASASTLVPGESCSDPCPYSCLPEASQFSFSPCVTGTFQTAAPVLGPRVSEFVSKWICARALKRNTWDSRSPLTHLDAKRTGLYSQMSWGLLYLALLSQNVEPSVGLGPLAPQGEPPQLRCPPWCLIATLWVWDLPFPYLRPSYQSLPNFLFIFLVIGLLFNFRWSSMMIVL